MNNIDIYTGIGINLFVYLLFTSFAVYGIYFPPKTIGPFGYKTPRSMKNQANWDYANALSNRVMFILAQVMLFSQLVILLFLHKKMSLQSYTSISTLLMIVICVLLLSITEYKLKQFEKLKK